MSLSALVLAIWAHMSALYAHQPDAGRIADAIAEAEPTVEEAATAALYVALESGVNEHPRAFSWDAKAGVSCGILQMPCAFVATHTLVEQVRWWLSAVRSRGLASVDSSPSRARAREAQAMRLLDAVR